MVDRWPAMYDVIVREFGLDKGRDEKAALMLDGIIKSPLSLSRLYRIISGRTIFIAGAGCSLRPLLPVLKRYAGVPLIAADSAVKALVDAGVWPDVVVTDLDGDLGVLRLLGRRKDTIMVVHAHGDNIEKLAEAASFRNCMGTAQGSKTGRLECFGGFTDGDRCVFLAEEMKAKNIILAGMDFDGSVGPDSATKSEDMDLKRRKLRRAGALLKWMAIKSRCGLYTLSSPLAGFTSIDPGHLDAICDSDA